MLDQTRIESFAQRMIGDLGAAQAGVLTNLGHKLGLYRAMAGAGPLSSSALADRTGLSERYVREWLNAQAAGGYVEYDGEAQTYRLPDEHAQVLVNAESPVFMAPVFDVVAAMWRSEHRLHDAFLSGKGIGWHEHDECLFCATDAFFRTGYRTHLVSEWLPALEGVEQKLAAGARVADIGCGYGASTILLAQAYPRSQFIGFDYHGESIAAARDRAREAGVEDRVHFEVATATDYPGRPYDLICFMDCLHDLGDPVGAARHARESLAADGTVMLVEPAAGDDVADNLHAVGRLYYAASTAFCTPNSLSQDVRLALGAQAGPKRLAAVMAEAGFGHVRKATATPFNMVLEARV